MLQSNCEHVQQEFNALSYSHVHIPLHIGHLLCVRGSAVELVEVGGGAAVVREVGHALEAGELRGVALHELDGVAVGEVLVGLEDLGVLGVVLAEQARLDEPRVQVLVPVANAEICR